MRTAARMYSAAQEGASLLSEGGRAAAEVKGSAAYGSLSLDAAFGLAKVAESFKSVASKFEVNKPDLIATQDFLRKTQRDYLERCAADRPHAAPQQCVAD